MLQRLKSDTGHAHVFSNEACLWQRLPARALGHVPESAEGTSSLVVDKPYWQLLRSPLSGAAPGFPKDETNASV